MIGGKLKKRLNPYPLPPAEAISGVKRTRARSAGNRNSFFMSHYLPPLLILTRKTSQ